ncbi:MAG: metal-dependent transcriptional regulator [candidate division Zixibacteria bacterium]|nr:metal-dependent transcriptional regulator [candidate division Zixibacteria bacterium]
MSASSPLSSSLEDYLETIYILILEKNAARVKDISQSLSVNYSSVTGALRSLSDKNLVNYAPYELVTLTAKGKNIGKEIYRRHRAIKNFFVKVLAVDEKLAEDSACKMEHAISLEIIDRLVKFSEYIERCPKGIAHWDESHGFSCLYKEDNPACTKCREA